MVTILVCSFTLHSMVLQYMYYSYSDIDHNIYMVPILLILNLTLAPSLVLILLIFSLTPAPFYGSYLVFNLTPAPSLWFLYWFVGSVPFPLVSGRPRSGPQPVTVVWRPDRPARPSPHEVTYGSG